MKRYLVVPYFFAIIIGFSLLPVTQIVLLFNNSDSYKAHGSLPDFNFAAAGDWACRADTTHDTVNNIFNKHPELVVGLGDYSYRENMIAYELARDLIFE